MIQTQVKHEHESSATTTRDCAAQRARLVVEGLNQDDLVHRYAPKVRYIAERIAARLPESVEIEDLISVGFIGLLDAAERYNPDHGSKFTTYAEFRIRGAIYDELRAQDWVPRRLRDRARELDRVVVELENTLARRPVNGEVAEALGLSRCEYQALRRDLGAMCLVSFEEATCAEHERAELREAWDGAAAQNPFAETSKHELRRHVAEVSKVLPERERMTLNLYYYRGLAFAEIGSIFGISEARVCQIHARAMLRLRTLLVERIRDSADVYEALVED